MEKKEEVWLPVKGFEPRFRISNHGRLISIGGRYKGEHFATPAIDSGGYYHTQLRMKPKYWSVRIHVLVGEHFVEGKTEINNCLNHLDGNKLNNYFENFEWTTLKKNCEHAIKLGLHDIKGEKHHNSILIKENVLQMRKLYFEEKKTHKQIGELFGVCRRQAGDVINGVNWGWLK